MLATTAPTSLDKQANIANLLIELEDFSFSLSPTGARHDDLKVHGKDLRTPQQEEPTLDIHFTNGNGHSPCPSLVSESSLTSNEASYSPPLQRQQNSRNRQLPPIPKLIIPEKSSSFKAWSSSSRPRHPVPAASFVPRVPPRQNLPPVPNLPRRPLKPHLNIPQRDIPPSQSTDALRALQKELQTFCEEAFTSPSTPGDDVLATLNTQITDMFGQQQGKNERKSIAKFEHDRWVIKSDGELDERVGSPKLDHREMVEKMGAEHKMEMGGLRSQREEANHAVADKESLQSALTNERSRADMLQWDLDAERAASVALAKEYGLERDARRAAEKRLEEVLSERGNVGRASPQASQKGSDDWELEKVALESQLEEEQDRNNVLLAENCKLHLSIERAKNTGNSAGEVQTAKESVAELNQALQEVRRQNGMLIEQNQMLMRDMDLTKTTVVNLGRCLEARNAEIETLKGRIEENKVLRAKLEKMIQNWMALGVPEVSGPVGGTTAEKKAVDIPKRKVAFKIPSTF
ncbi:hypothetical protein HK104_007837 [Borealophlyctis nickersoniae]|nr:hypothetical protein HK104_007837 [Borealophlyctis nickersoniae]